MGTTITQSEKTMLNKQIDVAKQIDEKLSKYFGVNATADITVDKLYKAVSLVTNDILVAKKQKFNQSVRKKNAKRVYYLCMEFLIGRNLKNALFNLSLTEQVETAIKKYKIDIGELFEIEKDPGLGNGGLGRLAACFMDSLASQNYPAMGMCLRYDYGLFKQKIVENQQVELPDSWLDTGEVWMLPRSDKTFKVHLGGTIHTEHDGTRLRVYHDNANVIEATAHDVMISGYDSDAISTLRLWKASATVDFDMKSFSSGDYSNAMRAKTEAEVINKVLYPSDDHDHGKQLRLSQQYFLVSASLQSIIKDHLRQEKTLDNLGEKASIHINDTHPALAVPELMRILMDDYGYGWDFAFDTTVKCMAYTNHTVLVEALETWSEYLVANLLPRIYQIIKEMDRRFVEEASAKLSRYDSDRQKIDRMRIINNGRVAMANLSIIGGHSVNGVSALHSDIIKDTIFSDFYALTPHKFKNVTNGIAYRRWLNQCNPRLTKFLSDTIGDEFKRDASHLIKFLDYKSDKQVLKSLKQIKLDNKKDFSNYAKDILGTIIDPQSRIDVQIKRLHEYKRQLLNVLKIIHEYLEIVENPNKKVTPQTFIFGAKAAGGYYHAKRIIQLINCISSEINKNPAVKEKLNVVFVENYNVSKAERIFPAAEVSEQISLAGKEASGTGNMKFMLNGALTLGTLDGANVEIAQEVGDDNIFIFGLKTEEVADVWRHGYSALNYFTQSSELHRVIAALKQGFAGESFTDIANYLVLGHNSIADPYMCLADFNDYIRATRDLDKAYADDTKWNTMSLVNISKAGIFSSDRSIRDYAETIWNLKRVDANQITASKKQASSSKL